MEFHHHYVVFTLLSLSFVASTHAANLSPQVYWKVKLPNTPMPRPIKDALSYSEKTTKNGNENIRMPQPFGDYVWFQLANKGDLQKLRQPFGAQAANKEKTTNHENEKIRMPQPFGDYVWFQPANEGDLQKLRQPFGALRWYQAANKVTEKTTNSGNENIRMPQPFGDYVWFQPANEGDLQELRQPFGALHQAANKEETTNNRNGNIRMPQPFGDYVWFQPANEGDLQKLLQLGALRWYQVANKVAKETTNNGNENVKMPQPFGDYVWFQPANKGDLQKLRQPFGDENIKMPQPFGDYVWFQPANKGDLQKLRQPFGDKNIKMPQPFGDYVWFQLANEGDLQKLRQPFGATKKEINENQLVTPYFFETDLHQGKKMNIPSLRSYNHAPILPRKVADSIPFSSDKIEEILNHFSIDKDSEFANRVKKTIKMCEGPAGNGEKKYCATSLESMVDFTTSQLGTNKILAMSTEVEKDTPEVQTYTIEEVTEKANGKGVICHKEAYPYAVHFCHDVGSTRTFKVSMVGADGTKVNAVSVCHEDTATMNPKALPFQLLNVKPGDKPICHFTLDDQVAMVPSQDAAKVA